MDEFRGIQTALFLMLLLPFAGAVALTVRDGDEVTLPCISERDDQNNCDRTIWFYSDSSNRPVVELVTDGQISEQAKDKSDRLRVTETCSLVIEKVTEKEDDGQYACRQIRSGQELDETVFLSVVTMAEQKDSDEVTLTCSVSIYRVCRHTVKWLFQGQDVAKDNRDLQTSQSDCSASVTFRTSHYAQTSSYQSLTCEVTDDFNRTPQLFPFRLSGEETTTESPTPESPTPESPTTESPTTESPTTESPPPESPTTESPTTESPTPESPTPRSGNSTAAALWWFIFLCVALAALIMTVVAINVWRRIKEKKTQTDEITVLYDADDDTVNYENITPPVGV